MCDTNRRDNRGANAMQLGLPLVVAHTYESRGVVYTKPWVVDLILDLAGYVAEKDLAAARAVEPAAGAGAFVRPMVRRLLASCRRLGRPVLDCRDALCIYELDPASAASLNKTVIEVLRGESVSADDAATLARAWIRCGDYLLDALTLPPVDYVLGNPPYVRLEEMDDTAVSIYRTHYHTMTGRADLYIAFFEAALRQLTTGGVCAFICADRWMFNRYGAALRRLVTDGYGVEYVLEMHDAAAFLSDVSAYPAIVTIRRGRQGSVVIAHVGAATEHNAGSTVSGYLHAMRSGDAVKTAPPGVEPTRALVWSRGDGPWPAASRQRDRLTALHYLEARFEPLESAETGTRVGIGVATGADRVFIPGDTPDVEPSRLLPLARVADIADGTLRWSGTCLVNPWTEDGLVALADYPRLAAYYTRRRAQLEDRHIVKNGRKPWYQTIDRVAPHLLGERKLYIPDIRDRLLPVLDDGRTYPHHNLYYVHSTLWDMEVLGGLLLSEVAQFFVECYAVRMRGGYLRFQAQYLRRIRVPRPQDIPVGHAARLADAFRRRDVELATDVALDLYGIDRQAIVAPAIAGNGAS